MLHLEGKRYELTGEVREPKIGDLYLSGDDSDNNDFCLVSHNACVMKADYYYTPSTPRIIVKEAEEDGGEEIDDGMILFEVFTSNQATPNYFVAENHSDCYDKVMKQFGWKENYKVKSITRICYVEDIRGIKKATYV